MKSMPVYRFSLPNQYNLILFLQVRYTKYLMWWYPTACTLYTNHFSKMLFEPARFRLCCRSFKQRSCCRLSISCGIRRLTTSAHWPSVTWWVANPEIKDRCQRFIPRRRDSECECEPQPFWCHPYPSPQFISVLEPKPRSVESLRVQHQLKVLNGERNPFRIPWHTSNLDLLGMKTRWRICPLAWRELARAHKTNSDLGVDSCGSVPCATMWSGEKTLLYRIYGWESWDSLFLKTSSSSHTSQVVELNKWPWKHQTSKSRS